LFSFKGNRKKNKEKPYAVEKTVDHDRSVAGVLGMVTGNTDAREMGYGSRASVHANAGVNHNARVTVRTRADFNARAQVRTRGRNLDHRVGATEEKRLELPRGYAWMHTAGLAVKEPGPA